MNKINEELRIVKKQKAEYVRILDEINLRIDNLKIIKENYENGIDNLKIIKEEYEGKLSFLNEHELSLLGQLNE